MTTSLLLPVLLHLLLPSTARAFTRCPECVDKYLAAPPALKNCRDVLQSFNISERVLYTEKPVVLTGFAPAASKAMWQPSTFLERYGTMTMSSLVDPPPEHHESPDDMLINLHVDVTVAEALQRAQSSQASLIVFAMSTLGLPESSPLVTQVLTEDLNGGPAVLSGIASTSGAYSVVSVQGIGSGHSLHSHGEAWLAQLTGKKAWFFLPPEKTELHDEMLKAGNPCKKLQQGHRLAAVGGAACVQEEGDILWFPKKWHHATCVLVAPAGVNIAAGTQIGGDLNAEALQEGGFMESRGPGDRERGPGDRESPRLVPLKPNPESPPQEL